MLVTLSLLEKIKKFEDEGETPASIVEGIIASESYKDVAVKAKTYAQQGNSPEDILDGIKSAKIDTSQQRGFRGFSRGGQPITSPEVSERPQEAVISAPQGNTMAQTFEDVVGFKAGPAAAKRTGPREEGWYSGEPTAKQRVGEFLIPLYEQIAGDKPILTEETVKDIIANVEFGAVAPAAGRVLYKGAKGAVKGLINAVTARFPEEQAVAKPFIETTKEWVQKYAQDAGASFPTRKLGPEGIPEGEIKFPGPANKLADEKMLPTEAFTGEQIPKFPVGVEGPPIIKGAVADPAVMTKRMVDEGGFSMRSDGVEPTDGFMVAIKGGDHDISPGLAGPDRVAAWQKRMQPWLDEDPAKNHMGGWFDKENNQSMLEPAKRYATKAEAMQVASASGERYIRDIAGKLDIPVPSKPLSVVGKAAPEAEAGAIGYKEPTTLEWDKNWEDRTSQHPLPKGQAGKPVPYTVEQAEPWFGPNPKPKPVEPPAGEKTVKGVLESEKGQIETGYHYAKTPRTTLRGSQTEGETQSYSKEIRARMQAGEDFPEHPFIPQVHVYGPEATPEVVVTTGRTRHKVKYELDDLYNLNDDPKGIWPKAQKIMEESAQPGNVSLKINAAINLIQKEGNSGYIAGKNRYLFGERNAEVGGIKAGLLPHMASAGVGAVVGGAVAPEGDKFQDAIIGGGVGLLIGTMALKKLLKGTPMPKGTKLRPKGMVEIPPIREGKLTEPIMKTEAISELGDPVSDAMKAKGIKRDLSKTMTEQVMEEVRANPGSRAEVFKHWGVTEDEFLHNLKSSLSLAARDMNLMSQYAKKLGVEPEVLEALEQAAKDPAGHGFDKFMYWWKRADNARRALLVSQLSTAMRNAEVQSGRFVIDALEQGVSSIFQKGAKMLGATIKEPVGILDGFEAALSIFGKNKAVTNKILDAFPGSKEKLLGTYMSDIAPSGKGGAWGPIDKALNIAGFFNRTQEFIIRRAVFIGKISKTLENKGVNLKDVVQSGKIIEYLTEEELQAGIQKSLEFTFAENAGGQAGRSLVNFINSVPGATWVMPFPRFLVNSLKFQYQYSPLGLLNLLSRAERSAIAEGNMKVLSRATIGSAMLGAAYLFRMSEYAGEKAWEIKIPGTERNIDMRPYNPLVGYCIIADIFAKMKKGELVKLEGKDIAAAIMGGNIRAGAGLFAVDKILNALTSDATEKNVEGAGDVLKGFAGEVVGGLATPINQVKEFLSGMDDFTIKNKKDEPFLGPTRSRIPGWEAGMEPVYSPTRSGPRKTALPAVRQATGLAISVPKNDLEKELDRLQFSPQEINPSTGIPKLDNLIAKELGELAEEELVPLMKDQSYLALGNAERAEFILDEYRSLRKDAKEMVLSENPDIEDELAAKGIPKRKRAAMKERGELE